MVFGVYNNLMNVRVSANRKKKEIQEKMLAKLTYPNNLINYY